MLKLMIPQEYLRRSTYHKSYVLRWRFFESHFVFFMFFSPEIAIFVVMFPFPPLNISRQVHIKIA